MRALSNFARALPVLMLSALAACGGGGGGSSGGGGGPPGGGINGGGIATGAITGFGSVIVNGVHFSTSGSTITIDDRTGASESELKVGQVVTIRGTFASDGTTGTATSITFDDNVEGPVSAKDEAAGTLVVLGQTVRIDGGTVFDNRFSPASLAGIAIGAVVEVSGFPNAAGEIVASHIEPKAAGGTFELTGEVSSLDTTARRFNLGATVIDYSGVTPTDGTLANGGCAEAKGTNFTGGALVATSVEVKSCNATGAANDRGEVEGVITRFASTTDFDVGAQQVTTTASTTYENGTAANLALDMEVEVEGTFNAAGVLTARKVEFKPDTSLRLLGTIDAIDAATSSVTVFGLKVTTNAVTAYEDQSAADLRFFKYSDLRTGDYVEVRGYAGTVANSLIAARIERDDLDSRRELQGVAASPAVAPNLTIFGITVTTSGGTSFHDESDASISSAAFFAAAGNHLVKVRGTWNGSSFVATEAELQSF